MSEESLRDPYFDLEPKRARPLSLWNPLDYLTLLWWIFYFPQALRWYVGKFVGEDFRDPAQRHLCVQALFLLVGVPVCALYLIERVTGVQLESEIFNLVVIFGAAGSLSVLFAVGPAFEDTLHLVFAGVSFLAGGVVFGVALDFPSGVMLALCGLLLSRAHDWLLGATISNYTFPRWCRPTPLPLPGVYSRLRIQFDKRWESGLWANNQLFQYTLQFSPAIAAQNEALAGSPLDSLLNRVALLAERATYPQALWFGSAPFSETMLVPLQLLGNASLRFDTPARCACAGFWLLHLGEPAEATYAFAKLREVRFGPELEEICRALAGADSVTQAERFPDWRQSTEGLGVFTEPLRKATLEALKELRGVAAEVEAALNAQARVNRSAALGRATATLQRLAQDADLPKPEGKILREIAQQWLPMVIELGGEAGEAILREPVKNPYIGYSGLPVEGPTFVGRADVLRQLERLWTGDGQNWAAIFLYGHRRMGKTSVLRNLQKSLRPGTVVVQLDMQGAAFVDHTGQLLFEFAKAIHKRCAEMNLDVGEKPRPEEFPSLGAGRLRLEVLLDLLEPQFQQQTLVLAIDEFEVLEERIEQGKVDPDFLTYLRSLNQRHRFLAIIFAGLHTLEEMGRHYGNAFFGQAEHVRVDYLKKADAMRLITQPSEDFSLEYSPALREELYRRTHGQPYLLQRLCWELVENFNELFLELGPKAPRTLELAELDALDADEFFLATHYYFDGLWGHRTAPEQQLLRRLAAAPGALSRTDLGDEDQKDIERLLRHDVVLVENDQIDFAAILLREWVARHHPLPE